MTVLDTVLAGIVDLVDVDVAIARSEPELFVDEVVALTEAVEVGALEGGAVENILVGTKVDVEVIEIEPRDVVVVLAAATG